MGVVTPGEKKITIRLRTTITKMSLLVCQLDHVDNQHDDILNITVKLPETALRKGTL